MVTDKAGNVSTQASSPTVIDYIQPTGTTIAQSASGSVTVNSNTIWAAPTSSDTISGTAIGANGHSDVKSVEI